ncbi:unnamed protein product [Dracunculus medinensis]|uniref:PPM-type phosphatase domain-containing protein n=1 Tax=Dracunculus medinensis TaxID=318479 RepID=A0A158Q4D9_DRAME|nr:unnamed protein product [Dracunculus medinensis]
MAAKRKHYVSLGLASLYDDLDSTSNDAESSNNVTKLADNDNNDNDDDKVLSAKKLKEDMKSDMAERFNASNLGAACSKMLLSVCGWRKGEREEMQDAHSLHDHFDVAVNDVKRCAFYAIFDGHAGRNAADYAAKYLPEKLRRKLSNCFDLVSIEKSMKKIFIETYKQIDEQFLIEARKIRPSWKDGTTATTIIIINDTVYCANIGDSKAVVCRSKSPGTFLPLQLTVDHSPIHFEERMRIQKAGGNVKDGRVMGILEVSRSIGDGQFKAYGVICTPDVKKFSITLDDRFIIMACDGLWKSFSSQEAVEFVIKKVEELKVVSKPADKDSLDDPRYSLWEKVADQLAAESVKRGCGDNVSVIIILLSEML